MKKRYRVFFAFGLAWYYEVQEDTPSNKKFERFYNSVCVVDLETLKKTKA